MRKAGPLCALFLLAVPLGGASLTARAEVSGEARSAADVYEHKSSLVDCLRFVASELKTRAEAAPGTDPAVLLLLVDSTTSMRSEIRTLAGALDDAWAQGPRALRIGVLGAGAEYHAPTGIPSEARSALSALAFVPADGAKNLLEAVRDGARRIASSTTGPKVLLLVTKEQGDGEDDVEATRDALMDAGVSLYAVAPEAGFERPWELDFAPNDDAERGLTERFHPEPRRREKGSLYFGGEVAFGLVPYRWEFDLAQADFVWVRPPRYPVPSGFGYWDLATLAHTTGGRYFVFDFAAAAAAGGRGDARRLDYDYGRLRLYAPDLRPRAKVLRDLEKDARAVAILRIWEHLANEACPVLQDLPTLERAPGGLAMRAARPVRSTFVPATWYEDADELKAGREVVDARLAALDQALEWWSAANAKERPVPAAPDPLAERVEADFQLLGVQLLKVRFEWSEARAAFDDVKPLDLTYRRVRILPRVAVGGTVLPRSGVDFGTPERNARFAELWTAQERMLRKYPQTPWALLLSKGWVVTFHKDVQVVPPEDLQPDRPGRTPDGADGRGADGRGEGRPAAPPAPPRPPAPPPPPGPRPGSGSGGATTGG